MKRFKMVFKSTWYLYVIGLVLAIVGAILVLVAGFDHKNDTLLFIGIGVAAFGILWIVISTWASRDKARSICANCEKVMLSEGKTVNYSYEVAQYQEKYDSQGRYTGTKFSYNVSIVCPHCGSTNSFAYSVTAKDLSKANVMVDRYIKNLLKMK